MDDKLLENKAKKILETSPFYLIPLIFLVLVIVCSIVLNIYFILKKDDLCKLNVGKEKGVQITEKQNEGVNNCPIVIPQNVDLNKRYHEIQVNNIKGFFDKITFKNAVLDYLSSKKIDVNNNLIDMKCTSIYSRDYPDYDDMSLYLDLSTVMDVESLGKVITNFNDYKLEDAFLISFLEQKNKSLKESDIESNIFNISSCDIDGDKKIVSYMVTEPGKSDLFIEYFENGKLVKVIQSTNSNDSISIYKGVEPCEPKPYLLLSDNSAYYRCTTGDAGYYGLYVFKADLTSGSFEEILNCISESDLGVGVPAPDIHCWELSKSLYD